MFIATLDKASAPPTSISLFAGLFKPAKYFIKTTS
jgi:hypothetical protein